MIILSSCLIWQIISLSFRWTNMVVHSLNIAVKVDMWSIYRRCRFWQKKNHLFRWNLFWSWQVCKQTKLAHLGHRKPPRIHWKFWGHFSSEVSKEWALQSMATVNGTCWTNFYSQKLRRRKLATFDFNTRALYATHQKLNPMFSALFLKIELSAVELMSFGHVGAAILTPLGNYL